MNILPSSDRFFSPVTGKILIQPGQVLLGDEQGHSFSSQTITLDNLPDLSRGEIWIGNKSGRPISSFKLIDLTVDVRELQAEINQIAFVLDQFPNLNNRRLQNVQDPIDPNDAATKEWVDSHTWLSSQITDLSSVPLSLFSPPVKDMNMNYVRIQNLSEPVFGSDAATKSYADQTAWVTANAQIRNYFIYSNEYYLRGDGTFGYPDLTHATGTLSPDKLEGFPSDNGVVLQGDGKWNKIQGFQIAFCPEDGTYFLSGGKNEYGDYWRKIDLSTLSTLQDKLQKLITYTLSEFERVKTSLNSIAETVNKLNSQSDDPGFDIGIDLDIDIPFF